MIATGVLLKKRVEGEGVPFVEQKAYPALQLFFYFHLLLLCFLVLQVTLLPIQYTLLKYTLTYQSK